MKIFKCNSFCMLLIFLYMLVHGLCPLARGIHVHVINRLGKGNNMRVHCQSHDNDLGSSMLQDGDEVKWSFQENIWDTTLFCCDVQWDTDSSIWYHFDAYDADRDQNRCWSECWWIIFKEGLLFGYDQASHRWECFP
uniref:S-protein homolog n=1 Tax=Nicotiana sylvestris TaxID=4096 RepID=A0A1U7YP67_NICSY|nr:PREDICTED: uncharacterized protein LOC104246522 [Nicotiana sylvestris]